MNQFLIYSLTFTGAVLFLTFIFFLVKNAAEGEIPERKEQGKIIPFRGETRRDAIVNYLCLDIEQEEQFFKFLQNEGIKETAPDETILYMHDKWALG